MNLKHLVAKTVSALPLYRLMPPGGFRTYAALRYRLERSSAEELTTYLESVGGIPTDWYATAIAATKKAFLAGADEVTRRALDELIAKFPDRHQPVVLLSELHSFRLEYDEALEAARRARGLASVPATICREVKASYRALPEPEADRVAVAAVRERPLTSSVLWAACKSCQTSEQYERLHSAWAESVRSEADLLVAVRQLATAAARAGRTQAAVDLFARAIGMLFDGEPAPEFPPDTTLKGRGAWSAIVDIHSVLSEAGIPHFFAAGTALGLVREGRPLSADSDIDVGIFEADYDRERLVKLFDAHPRFEPDVVNPRTPKVGLRHRGGSPVDLFRFYPDGGKYFHDAVWVRWGNEPFGIDWIDVRGTSLPVPTEQDRYLRENYGDWRTPDPAMDAFTDDAPNVEVLDRDFERLHYLRRAFRALIAGDRVRAAADMRRGGFDDLAARVK